jgi:hypothetical protein
MPLANMREHGVRSVDAECRDCKREAVANVDSLPDGLPVPDVALRLRCSACGQADRDAAELARAQAKHRRGVDRARTDARTKAHVRPCRSEERLELLWVDHPGIVVKRYRDLSPRGSRGRTMFSFNRRLSTSPKERLSSLNQDSHWRTCGTGASLSNESERDAPRMTRAIQDRIGRELRAMYEELLRQPLPENLIAPLRAADVFQSARQDLQQSVLTLRAGNTPPNTSVLSPLQTRCRKQRAPN